MVVTKRNRNVREVSWHEENLRNMKRYAEKLREAVVFAQESLDRSLTRICLLETQITEAKRRGNDSFDCEKFLVKRKK